MELLWDGGTKICSNGPGHMTKMDAMPIYGKNLFLSSPEPKAHGLETWCASSGARVLPSLLKLWPWIDLDLFYGKVKYSPLCFCMGKKVKQWIFLKTIVVYPMIWNLTTDDWSDKKFLLTSKLCPMGGCMPPAPGLYTCIKSWIFFFFFLYKIKTSKRFLWNFQQMGKVIRPFCWHQNFVPWGLSVSVPGLYTCIKSWKNCIKSDFSHLFETCNKWMKWQDISVDIKTLSPGVWLPLHGGYVHV